MVNIFIFDYGAGNIFSLKYALKRSGADVTIINNFDNITDQFDGLVLPGVGNFDPAISSINKCKEGFLQYIKKNIPILGICLGMEMLFEKSEEGKLKGLDIFDGEVVSIPKDNVKIPHIGWNELDIIKNESRLLDGVSNSSYVYFNHSYYVKPKDKDIITAISNHGIPIPASIEKDNIFCTQFHPEKSSDVGKKMLENYLEICKRSK